VKLRNLLLIGAFGIAGAAHASFEMMLLATNTGIHRFDPVNRVYLGKFAQNDGTMLDVAADKTHPGQAVAITADGSVMRYDFNSGLFLGGFHLGAYAANIKPHVSVMNNGNLLITNFDYGISSSRVRIFSPTGTLISNVVSGSGNSWPVNATELPNGNVFVSGRFYNSSSYDVYLNLFNTSGTYLNGAYLSNTNYAGSYTEFGWLGSKLVISCGADGRYISDAKFLSGTEYLSSSTMNFSSYYITANCTRWAEGHNGIGYAVQGVTTTSYQNFMYTYNPISDYVRNSGYAIPITDTVNNIAMVNAPEPGAFVAMAVGLGALCARRRKSAKH